MFIVVGLLYIIHMTPFPSQEMRGTTVQPGGNWLKKFQASFTNIFVLQAASLVPGTGLQSIIIIIGKKGLLCKKRTKKGPFQQFGP